jgi:hypothetical protein
LATSIESTNSIPFAGKAVTLSFYARAGANYSATSNALPVYLYGSTGTDQNILAAWAGSSTVGVTTATLTTTWQRFVVTGTVASTVTQLGIQTYFSPIGTASTNDWYEITGVQIDLGTYTASTAPTFRRSGGTIQGELAACQRYYYRLNSSAASNRLGLGQCRGTTEAIISTTFPVPMRVAPTALEQTGTASNYLLQDASGSGVNCNTVPAFNDGTTYGAFTSMTRASGLVAGNACTATTSAANIYLGWSAEL